MVSMKKFEKHSLQQEQIDGILVMMIRIYLFENYYDWIDYELTIIKNLTSW